jgi:hypothetical protein
MLKVPFITGTAAFSEVVELESISYRFDQWLYLT